MSRRNRLLRYRLFSLVVLALTIMPIQHLSGQTRQRQTFVVSVSASDLVTLASRCASAEPLEESLELFRKYACSQNRSQMGEILAFEENRRFVYALAEMPLDSADEADNARQPARWLRRVFLLKPSTLVIEDVVHWPSLELAVNWILRDTEEPKIEADQFRVGEGDIVVHQQKAALPSAVLAAHKTRFLHALNVDRRPIRSASAKKSDTETSTELTVAGQENVLRLTLPKEDGAAGEFEITSADGAAIVPRRLLPSSVMPHGPKGTELMERWDAPYRRERMPGWDVGRPCTHLVAAVEDGTFKPGRAIVLGCGSGTNAIYLASKGFEVTGVDVSPTALTIAAKKAGKANVEVEWKLADVVALPKLEAYDLVFDRGCYHHICQYDSPGYVETLRRLSRAGTQAMILAGSPADGRAGGPPRIKEETIRNDFSTLFEFAWLRDIHFDSANPDAKGPSAWSIHLRRKAE